MATTDRNQARRATDLCREFLATYYQDEISRLAQTYPKQNRSLVVEYGDVFQFDPDLADDLLQDPDGLLPYLETALGEVDIPAEIDLSGAHVRIAGLPEMYTHYPGEFSPSEHEGRLRSIQGEISKATDVYARMESAAFECQRCGTLTRIPQVQGDFQEPHECQGCERQGPFRINYPQSSFVDGQKLRLQTPPEEAQGDGQDVDIYLEDDYADVATAGDRVTITGTVCLDQQESGSTKRNKFEAYLDGLHVAVEETDAEDIDISSEQRERIEELAAGEDGNPLELAAESLAPKIHGYPHVKKAIILALVGGARTEYAGGDFDRGEFHVLLIGDPSTAKSKLVERAEQVGWRSVGVSGTGATKAGVTATAIQDDFGDGSWALDAGAAVKAHRGVLAVDELDDMPEDVRSALLEPMSKQTIHITKGGINTHLQTRTAVVAAANPDQDRFDPYEPIASQFAFSSTLLSRFDLVYTFRDVPNEQTDDEIAEHILSSRDAAKRLERGEDVDESTVDPRPPIEPDLLRAWLALAKQQPKPVFANESIKEHIKESFTSLRGLYGYEPDDPVPVTWRSLEGTVRVAEAAARFEFSDTIEKRHVEIATELIGQSMQDVGKDPDSGELDADIKETGSSKSQKSRKKTVRETIKDLQSEANDDMVAEETVVDTLEEYSGEQIRHDIERMKRDDGVAIEPEVGYVRYIGEW